MGSARVLEYLVVSVCLELEIRQGFLKLVSCKQLRPVSVVVLTFGTAGSGLGLCRVLVPFLHYKFWLALQEGSLCVCEESSAQPHQEG